MKVRRLSAAALLAAALGTAVLAGAAPAAALAGDPPPSVTRGPFSTLEQCQADRDHIIQRYGAHVWVTQCWSGSGGYYFKAVSID
ncbi:hypothetical protein [Streptosporangium carneum]|uniref:Uncharacterized protein n=1 Tax=Streptosporangium carneum TaxID=47481 RepID=A0A9W6MFL7_9ACTN|nr:hypothetical protein [Streptosporangium carneum]GLK12205.1 hypothetical protein GCM10017600_56140 [Streptosporangium carneum]